MTKEKLERAQQIQTEISRYEKIIRNCSFPYICFWNEHRLFFAHSTCEDEVCIDDKELKKIICDYAQQKVKELEEEYKAI